VPLRIEGTRLEPGEPEPLEERAVPPGTTLVTPGATNVLTLVGPGETRSLEMSSSLRLENLPQKMPMRFAAVSPDRLWLARSAPHASGTAVVQLRTGEITSLSEDGGPVAWSADGQWLVTSEDKQFVCWNTTTWHVEKTWTRESAAGNPGQCLFSADGNWLAIAVSSGSIQLINARTLNYGQTLVMPRDRMTEIAFSRDGRVFAAGADSGAVRVWRLDEIEKQLSALGLGSDAMRRTKSVAPAGAAKLWPATLPLGGAFAALVVALHTFRHQRRLVASYGEIDALVTKRSAELAHAHTELLRAEKMKALGTLAAGIAHDFNNLLSVIRLSNDFLRRGVTNDPELHEEVDSIQQAVERGRDVVNSVLGYSRGNDETKSTADLAQLVEDTIGLLNRQFLSGIRLTLELAREAQVQASGPRLQQILLNLIVNASEAMNGQGSLRIIVQSRPAAEVPANAVLPPRDAAMFMELSVADSGPGIPAEILPRIFEPFFTTKQLGAKPGTGLGLATVYRIAQDEGLGVAVESQPGAGATFRLFVPVG
jgi:signal transduction histidine kinase